ncbi:hypothetical protein [Pseudomonas quasicaspiana]|uniref:hypothetical protein n=1 Tax=Pseudomonas quasicaspiana TaxID=2829821 RepID=UPI001E4832B1|nr:hypothetical protein [Pseudomonas quasicaspiana]MCD5978963.1 hypothetical protein [Pseudomonas quasicaspiana]
MTFAKRVRDNKVTRPNQRSFKLEEWKKAFLGEESDQESRDLYEAGIWFAQAFEAIRGKLSFAADKTMGRDEKLFAFVRHANMNAIRYRLSIRDLVINSSSESPAEQSASYIFPKVYDSDGTAHSLDQVATSDIDGLQLPLRMILSQKPLRGQQQAPPEMAISHDIASDYALGGFYKSVEELWEECLWNNYALTASSEGIKLTPTRPSDAKWKWVTLSRRSAVHHANTMYRHTVFEQSYRQASHASLGIPRPIQAIETTDGVMRFILAAEEKVDRSSSEIYVLMQEALEPYYTQLARFQSPRLGAGTIIDVIKCWAVLQSLVTLLEKGVHVSTAELTPEQILAGLTSPRIERRALVDAICDSLNVSADLCNKLLDFLTYSPSSANKHEENELWTQPIIALNEKELLLLYTPCSHGTTQRNVNIWLRQLGANFDMRGLPFEQYLRDALAYNITLSPIQRDIALMPHALKFNLPEGAEPEYQYEDIDIVMRIGDTVLIGEAKCFLQPVDPDEVFKHREKVIAAQVQLKRKVHHVEKYRQQFREECARRNFRLPEDFKLQPVILLNGQSHCGIPCAGTPIVDINILATFIRGVLRRNLVSTIAGGLESAQEYVLYRDVADATACLEAYLMSPPQLQRYADALVERQTCYREIVDGLEPLFYDHFEVDLSRVMG